MTLKSALAPRADATEVARPIDLTGKTAVITGAASGIGTETARALLLSGARVILAVRDVNKGEAVAQTLRSETGNGQAQVVKLDLSSLASVREGAANILSLAPQIDMLINNAGVMATPQGHTADGFETQFGTNHLGHFLLFKELLPALRGAAAAHGSARVVALSSIGHRRSDILWDDPNYATRPYDKWEAYGQSKTANALFALGLTQRYAAQGITANAVHPGGIMTGLQKHLPEDEMRAMGWMNADGKLNAVFKTPAEGASTTVWAATAPELEGVGGLYLEDLQEAQPFDESNPGVGYKPYIRDPESATRLWELSEKLLAEKGY